MGSGEYTLAIGFVSAIAAAVILNRENANYTLQDWIVTTFGLTLALGVVGATIMAITI